MSRAVIASLLCILVVVAAPNAADATEKDRSASMSRKHVALFESHCYDCHSADTKEAGVDLESISFDVGESVGNAELWQKILNAINSGEMPPEDSEPLADKDKLVFLEDLTGAMVEARKILGDSGGVIPLRRLNRREYSNTIESLLGIRPDVSSLPNDQVGAGFDTQGGSLFMSSDQIEQYYETAKATLRYCLKADESPNTKVTRIELEDEYTERYRTYLGQLADQAERARKFLAQSEKPASAFGLIDEYQAKKNISSYENWKTQLEQYLEWPETKEGAALILTIKGGMTRAKLPPVRSFQPGRYRVRVRAAMYPEADERFHYLEFSSNIGKSRTHLGWRKVTAPLASPQVIEFVYDHQPGQQVQLLVHQRTHQDRGDKGLWTRAQRANGVGTPPGIWIDWAEISGPEPFAGLIQSKSKLLAAGDEAKTEAERARLIIEDFAGRAFRGKQPTQAYVEKLVDRFREQREAGDKFDEAIVEPLAIILASPGFLYMINDGRQEDGELLTDSEVAVRMSYLLWSQPPDETLMRLADRGELSNPGVLRQQVERMLADPKAERFVRDFTHQWLEMDRLGMFQFNGLIHPTFDNAVRENAREEIFQTVNAVLGERLPLGTLLNADFVVINDLLAGYYGMGNVEGHEFRRHSLPPNSVRGGLLATAAVAAMGSDGLRSSPVERGAWVLRHLLHDPPAPAPPNVPQLSRLEGEPHSARDLQVLHQEQPQCAQCHRKIDPIGYGLENFAADGLWRDKERVITGKIREINANSYAEFEIDPSGTLPSGESFEGFHQLRELVASKQEVFARGFVESLIAYGMGRPYGFTDQDLANEILDQARDDGFAMPTMIQALVVSETFRSK